MQRSVRIRLRSERDNRSWMNRDTKSVRFATIAFCIVKESSNDVFIIICKVWCKVVHCGHLTGWREHWELTMSFIGSCLCDRYALQSCTRLSKAKSKSYASSTTCVSLWCVSLWCVGMITKCCTVSRFDTCCIQVELQASVVQSYCHYCHFLLCSIRTTLA